MSLDRNRYRDREKPLVLPLSWWMKDDFDSDPETAVYSVLPGTVDF